jgi:putative sterol carrier protein
MPQRVTDVRDVFAAMPGRFLPDQAGDLSATIQFDLSGEGGGQWHVTIAGGKASVAEGVAPNAHMTMSVSAADYLAIVNGELDPMQAFMQGKVKITGDVALALKMQQVFARG